MSESIEWVSQVGKLVNQVSEESQVSKFMPVYSERVKWVSQGSRVSYIELSEWEIQAS